MAKYLVTGGCGFIGSHLVDGLLNAGHEVTVVDNLSTGKIEHLNPEATFLKGEVTDPLLINKILKNMDGCFHLAAIASVEYSNTHWLHSDKVNLKGTVTVLDCAKSAKDGAPIPVVYASSAAVYGDNPDMPLNELARPQPLSAYGADKLSSEYHARIAYKVHHIPTVGLRIFNVYGPRQSPDSPYSGVISIFFDQMLRGETIKIFGDGEQTRDFIYVSDVVNYFIEAMNTMGENNEVYNVCTGRSTTLNNLVDEMADVMHKDGVSKIHAEPRSGDIQISVGDPSYAEQRLNIKAKVSLHQGLTEMLMDYYSNHDRDELMNYYTDKRDH